MKKLKLDLDSLAVDSYATQATEAGEGTVAAHSDAPMTPILTPAVTKTVEWTIVATEFYTIL